MCETLIVHCIQLHNTAKGSKATLKDRSYSNRAASLLWISAAIFSPHLSTSSTSFGVKRSYVELRPHVSISYLFELLILLSRCTNMEACNEPIWYLDISYRQNRSCHILHEHHTSIGQSVMITAFNALYSTPFAVASGTIICLDPHIKTWPTIKQRMRSNCVMILFQAKLI